MPKFTVSLCRETLEFAELEINADSSEEAGRLALQLAKDPRSNIYWEDAYSKEPEVNEIL